MLLSTLTAALLSATVTNTETVHDLAAYNGHVVACTEGGLELFTRAGRAVRTLTVDDGLPSHFCRALEVAGDRLFAATDEGVVAVDTGWRVEPVMGAKWHALPAAGGMNAELYRAALGWLSERLPAGPTYTAFTEGYLGTADGRVMAPGSGRMWTVPGPVRLLEEAGGSLRVGTTEGAFTLGPEGLVSLPVPTGPLAYAKEPKGGTRVLGAEGEARRWGEHSGEARVLPTGVTSALEVNGVAWAGTRGQGVFRRQGGEWKRVTPSGQLCGNHITALTRHQGRRVVGTFDKGVCWEQPGGKWRTFRAPHLPSNHVLGLASDGRNLYVATLYGLGLYDGKTWTPMAYGGRNPVALGKLSVLAAVADTEDGVALVDGRGTSFVKRASQPLELARRLPLPEGWSTHVSGAHGAGPYLWVASEDRGLVRWDGTQWTRFHDGKHLTDNWVTALSADAEGRAVVGTCQDGFSYFDGERWTRVRDAEGLPSRYVVSAALVPGGALLGTLLGAAHYDAASGTVHPLSRLADPRVYALLVEEGTVLFGTEGGLSQLDWSAPAAKTPASAAEDPDRLLRLEPAVPAADGGRRGHVRGLPVPLRSGAGRRALQWERAVWRPVRLLRRGSVLLRHVPAPARGGNGEPIPHAVRGGPHLRPIHLPGAAEGGPALRGLEPPRPGPLRAGPLLRPGHQALPAPRLRGRVLRLPCGRSLATTCP